MRATMDIAGWLRSFGLEEYEEVFRENKISERLPRSPRVLSAIITVFGSAMDCSLAARFGVSPTMPRSWDFELQDLGAQDLKGLGAPVRAWGVLRPASVESRLDALHASGLTDPCWSRGGTRTAPSAVVKGEDRR